MSIATSVDIKIAARWIVTVDAAFRVLEQHQVLVNDGRIVAILPDSAADKITAKQSVSLPEHVLMPGLVNLHTHAAMSLMRGFADDVALMPWLNDHIWPAEAAHATDDFVFDGTLLAAAESIRAGVTCINEMYFYPAMAARAFQRAGLRATVGMSVLEFPTRYAQDADDYIAQGLAARDEYGDAPLLRFALAPHAPYTVSDNTFERVRVLAEELNLNIHCHVHETAAEIQESLNKYGVRPLARLAQLGLVSPSLIGVHMVHLDAEDIRLLATHGTHVAHCPTSNLKLASGIMPTAALLKAGINVGIGTDGPASNNRLDMWAEMRLAALLAKGQTGDATVVSAQTALEMATMGGARALGLDGEIGSLEVGKAADLIAVDLSGPENQPCYDPVSQLVYAAGRENVTDVWVAGKRLMQTRQLQTLDQTELLGRALRWHEKISVNMTPTRGG